MPQARWLTSYPSFGFLLALAPEHAAEVSRAFRGRGIRADPVGRVTEGATLTLRPGAETALV